MLAILSAQQDIYRQVYEVVPDAIIIANSDREILHVNPAFERLFGYTSAELVGRTSQVLFENRSDFETLGEWRTSPEGLDAAKIHSYVTKSGGRVTAETRGSVLRDADGHIVGLVVILRDITERYRAQKTLEELYEITATPMLSSAQKISGMLRIGLAHFRLSHGVVTHIEGSVYTVLHAVTPGDAIKPGSKFDLRNTCCSHTFAADGPTGFHHGSQSAIRTHPCFRELRLDSYLGCHLNVEGRRYGTVDFSSFEPRGPISDTDRRVIELFASWIGYELALQKQIEQIERAREEMALLALTDELTGIANRREFMRLANREWRRYRRRGTPLTVVMIDADHFKEINDAYGHETGDEVLRVLAKRMAAVIRPNDILGRLGGEEFALVLPETSPEDAIHVAERVRACISDIPMETATGALIPVTVSVGLAPSEPKYTTLDQALAAADQAVYRAKSQGRNQVVRAGP